MLWRTTRRTLELLAFEYFASTAVCVCKHTPNRWVGVSEQAAICLTRTQEHAWHRIDHGIRRIQYTMSQSQTKQFASANCFASRASVMTIGDCVNPRLGWLSVTRAQQRRSSPLEIYLDGLFVPTIILVTRRRPSNQRYQPIFSSSAVFYSIYPAFPIDAFLSRHRCMASR
jgi:hypothetical protein